MPCHPSGKICGAEYSNCHDCLLFRAGEGGKFGQPGSKAGREELAERKSALRTGPPGLTLGRLFRSLDVCTGAITEPAFIKHFVRARTCALSPLILTHPRQVGTVTSVLKRRAKAWQG